MRLRHGAQMSERLEGIRRGCRGLLYACNPSHCDVTFLLEELDAKEARLVAVAKELAARNERIAIVAAELCKYGDADYWTNAKTHDIAERLLGNRELYVPK